MKTADSNLWVCLGKQVVWIKVEGRATFNCSVDFKTLVNGLWQKGYHKFHIDLTKCLLMDSTFLGMLSGLGIKFAPQNGTNGHSIQLINPNARIADLLENLGVNHLFAVHQEETSQPEGEFQQQTATTHTPKELACNSLEAHQTLMSVNPNNVEKFKEVARFLAEDLQKLDNQPQ